MIKQKERNNYCIDHKQKIIWVRVPKVASTSIRNAWKDNLARNLHFGEAKSYDYFTVMFVRDPIDRLISAYLGNWKNTTYTIEGFIDEIIKHKPQELNRHIRPQWCFAEGLKIDFIGRFETLNEDWEKLRERFDLNPLPHANPSKKKDINLSQEMIDKLRIYYRKDYDLYFNDTLETLEKVQRV